MRSLLKSWSPLLCYSVMDHRQSHTWHTLHKACKQWNRQPKLPDHHTISWKELCKQHHHQSWNYLGEGQNIVPIDSCSTLIMTRASCGLRNLSRCIAAFVLALTAIYCSCGRCHQVHIYWRLPLLLFYWLLLALMGFMGIGLCYSAMREPTDFYLVKAI